MLANRGRQAHSRAMTEPRAPTPPSERTPSATVPAKPADDAGKAAPKPRSSPERARETGGRKGLDPTRYGDWEKDGRCVDF